MKNCTVYAFCFLCCILLSSNVFGQSPKFIKGDCGDIVYEYDSSNKLILSIVYYERDSVRLMLTKEDDTLLGEFISSGAIDFVKIVKNECRGCDYSGLTDEGRNYLKYYNCDFWGVSAQIDLALKTKPELRNGKYIYEAEFTCCGRGMDNIYLLIFEIEKNGRKKFVSFKYHYSNL